MKTARTVITALLSACILFGLCSCTRDGADTSGTSTAASGDNAEYQSKVNSFSEYELTSNANKESSAAALDASRIASDAAASDAAAEQERLDSAEREKKIAEDIKKLNAEIEQYNNNTFVSDYDSEFRTRDYFWVSAAFRRSGTESLRNFVISILGEEKYDSIIHEKIPSMPDSTDAMSEAEVRKQPDSLPEAYTCIDFFGITKEQFIAQNEKEKRRYVLNETGHLKLSEFYTDSQIDMLFSGNEAEIRKAFCANTALLYNGRIYTYIWLETCSVDEIRAAGIPKSVLTAYVSKIESVIKAEIKLDGVSYFGGDRLDAIKKKISSL